MNGGSASFEKAVSIITYQTGSRFDHSQLVTNLDESRNSFFELGLLMRRT
jgi:hypothetical protein